MLEDYVTPAAELQDVSLVYPGGVGALDHVSLALPSHTIIGLVGESGSGKTSLCRVLMGLQPPTEGLVLLGGQPIAGLDRLVVRRRAQMLLQDAVASLSPRMRIRKLLAEPLAIHGLPRAESWARVEDLLHRLGLSPDILQRFPHQISGGQARRVAVVRALALSPELIVADEPTAGLDVSVQGELLNLLLELQREMRMTYLLASHNLNVIRRITSRTVVMYLGQIVEEGGTDAMFAAPAHPYTAALLSTNPAIDPARRRTRIVLRGDPPSVTAPPAGCRFHTRCFQAQPRCSAEEPELRPAANRSVRCHFPLGTGSPN